jgi:cyanate lyase
MRRVYPALKAKASEEEFRALGLALQLSPEWLESVPLKELGPHWYPNRGIGPIPPTDPVIYRLFEVTEKPYCHAFLCLPFLQGVLVYGHAIKVS